MRRKITAIAAGIVGLLIATSNISLHAQEKARSADSFVESMGINNIDVEGTTINSSGAFLSPIYNIGFRYARSPLLNTTAEEAGLFDNYGVRFDYLWPANYTAANMVSEVQSLPTGSVISVEGNNECDNEGANGGIGIPAAVQLQESIYDTFKGTTGLNNMQVLPYTIINNSSYTSTSNSPMGNSTNAFDCENYHPYPGTNLPYQAILNGFESAHLIETAGNPYKPLVVTETGENLSPLSQAKLTPMIYADNFQLGVSRTYIYALATGQYGFSIAGEPAGSTMQNMISTLGEATWSTSTHQWTYPNYDPGYLSYYLNTNGVVSVRHMLLQKSTGDFYLLAWNEVPVYNSTTETDIDNASVPITLSLGTNIASASAITQSLTGSYTTTSLSISGSPGSQSVSFSVPDSIMIVHLTPVGGLAATQQPSSVYDNLVYAVNAGDSSAVGNFVADNDFLTDTTIATGGATSTTATIGTSGVTNPAPQGVYQTQRYGVTTYNTPSLVPAQSYLVRMHFAETYFGIPDEGGGGAGSRMFDADLNGDTCLSDFDIYATAGDKANQAVIEQFESDPSCGGQVEPQFLLHSANNPAINGIDVDSMPLVISPTIPTVIPGYNYDPIASVGYYTANTSNYGVTLYRPDPFVITGQDINATEGVSVQYLNTGDWLRYTMNVAAPGTYQIGIRYAGYGGACHFAFGPIGGSATTTTESITLPQTSSNWTNYETVTTTVTLPAGQQWMKFYCDASGYNFDNLTITPVTTGTAYEASTAILEGTADLYSDSTAPDGEAVGAMGTAGASITFNNVSAFVGGEHVLLIGYAEGWSSTASQHILVNGTPTVVTFPYTNSWTGPYSAVSLPISLNVGMNTIEIECESGDGPVNIDQIVVQ